MGNRGSTTHTKDMRKRDVEKGALHTPHSNQSHNHPLPPRENPGTTDQLTRRFPVPILENVCSGDPDIVSAARNYWHASVCPQTFLRKTSSWKVDLTVDFVGDVLGLTHPKH
jgi:hypothetical protein